MAGPAAPAAPAATALSGLLPSVTIQNRCLGNSFTVDEAIHPPPGGPDCGQVYRTAVSGPTICQFGSDMSLNTVPKPLPDEV